MAIDREYVDNALRSQFDSQGGIGYVLIKNPLMIREGYSREWQAVLSPSNSQQNKVAADGQSRPIRLVTEQKEWDRLVAARHAAGYREEFDKSLTLNTIDNPKSKTGESAGIVIDDEGQVEAKAATKGKTKKK